NDFFLPRVVLDRPADGGAAREADELDAFIGDQQTRILVREQHGVESAVRPSRLLDYFGQQQRGERRLGSGLEHMEQPAAMAGATLWATRFKGKLKGVIPAMGPRGKRLTIPQRPAVDCCQSSGKYSP